VSRTKKVLDVALPALFASWFISTVLCQHPDRGYDKVRKLDKTGSGIGIPNWRFFAPEPAVEDQHFLYRLANEDKTEHSEWRSCFTIAPRKAIHAIWFPGRRVEKAVFDVASTLLNNKNNNSPLNEKARVAAHDLMVDAVRRRLTPEPGFPYFQIMLIRYSGYDHSEPPKYDMVFDYEKVAV
jgi:hypothetical protein